MNFRLRCHLCQTEYPAGPLWVCTKCLGPLEVAFDHAAIARTVTREMIERRPKSLWRYRELLPIEGEPRTGLHSGFTPLVRADRLAERLGVRELYVKDDSVNHPTCSYKDRVVSVAATRAVELGFNTFACASTGNLAGSVAAHAARLGLSCSVFIPDDLEAGKVAGASVYNPRIIAVRGNYDDVNRLCTQLADEHPSWAFVNVNVRTYYGEGSKTLAFEVAEQLGWQAPDHVVVPIASGSQLTKIHKGFKELHQVGLLDGDEAPHVRVSGAQATGCSPVATAFAEQTDVIRPQRPSTIAKSLAIGNPADGFYALDVVRKTGGAVGSVTDDEIVEGIRLLARTEGIFAETAGGVTIATLAKLAAEGVVRKDERVVAYVTGNGLKTIDAVSPHVGPTATIAPTLDAFNTSLADLGVTFED